MKMPFRLAKDLHKYAELIQVAPNRWLSVVILGELVKYPATIPPQQRTRKGKTTDAS